ncbi:glycosyltransferase 87 family protein [Micromonospora craterilacus]|nr:glycosyltransferase 87 family protein [Micromonospora craterilacus]
MSLWWKRRVPGRRWLVAAVWASAVTVAVLQTWAALRRPFVDRLSDLQVYLGAVNDLWNGDGLYDFAAEATGAPFTYPPFAGLLFAPLALPPFAVIAVIWSVATFAVVVAVAVAAVRRSEFRATGTPWLTPLFALALFASSPISSNFRFGQISVFLVAAVLADVLRLVPERYRGILTGVACAVKLTPLVFVPYFWFSGQRRAAVTSVAAFVACTGIAWLVLPDESVRFWFTEIWNVNRVGNIETGGNQSLNGALLRWGLPDLIRSSVVAVVGSAIVVLALIRATRAYRNDQPLAAAVLVGAAGLVFSPVSWTHHQVWLLLAALLAVSARPRWSLLWPAVVLVVMILPVTSRGASLPGGFLLGDARLWLAVAVAVFIPFVAVRRVPAESPVEAGTAQPTVEPMHPPAQRDGIAETEGAGRPER